MTMKSGRGKGQSRTLPEKDRALELAREAA